MQLSVKCGQCARTKQVNAITLRWHFTPLPPHLFPLIPCAHILPFYLQRGGGGGGNTVFHTLRITFDCCQQNDLLASSTFMSSSSSSLPAANALLAYQMRSCQRHCPPFNLCHPTPWQCLPPCQPFQKLLELTYD